VGIKELSGYELTYEEVKIIQPKFTEIMSKKEYEKLAI